MSTDTMIGQRDVGPSPSEAIESSASETEQQQREWIGEGLFRTLFAVEQRRSERNGRPFLLALIEPVRSTSRGRFTKGRLLEPLPSCLAREVMDCTREVDVKGWYRKGSTIGVLYPDTGIESHAVLAEKLSTAVRSACEHAQHTPLSVSWYAFPPHTNHAECRPCSQTPLRSLSPMERIAKRALDIAGALAGLVVFAPAFLLVPIPLKLTSRGPVFFRQERIGKGGKPFTFLKFRSMYLNNDQEIHRAFVSRLIEGTQEAGVYKIEDDPRVTPVGRFLRKTSLDEIPQFFNVLKGDMSLVGPRPPLPYEVERYNLWHRRRVMETKPGITGLWQVEGRSATTFDEMVRMDLRYVKGASLRLDLLLLFRTVSVLFSGRGAY